MNFYMLVLAKKLVVWIWLDLMALEFGEIMTHFQSEVFFLFKTKTVSREQQAWGSFKRQTGHNRLKNLSSPSIHGSLGRFWRSCWRCRLPGSQVCQEWCSTGRHRDGTVSGGRISQQFDWRHPCVQSSLSEGRGSYLSKRKVHKLVVVFLLHTQSRREMKKFLCSVFVRCVNLIQRSGWAV